MRSMMAAVGAVGVVCAAVAGCTINVGTPTEPAAASGPGASVSKDVLAKDISDRMAKAGQTPSSVRCPDDLLGEVGKTTRCEVASSATTASFEALVTVTTVQGTQVNYTAIPAVSKTQLEAAVSAQIAHSSRAPVDAVVCEAGLDGTVGTVAHCAVTATGATVRRTVAVTGVTGFAMQYTVVPILTKEVAADSILAQLGRVGARPDSASCLEDLDGIVGNTVECSTLTAGRTQRFVLTVTTVTGSNITYRYDPKP